MLGACQEDSFITDSDARLAFSVDSMTFDTVFTTLGSVTELFLVFNEHNEDIEIDRIELAGGPSSNFRINVDGSSGTFFSDVSIAERDSAYIFVEVTVDQSQQALPFVIEDSILFETNGNLQKIKLTAWGQNAIFHLNDTIVGIEDWTDELPHVIFGGVVIPEDQTLNIEQGVNVFAHAGSVLFVEGELNVNGQADSLVTFGGDRLESFFDDLPAQWGGIFVVRGENSGGVANISYADINSTVIGLNVGSSACDWLNGTVPMDLSEDEEFTFIAQFFADCFQASNVPSCVVENTVIRNSLLSGITAVWSDIEMTNSLIYNCGDHNLQLELGGEYDFKHCTVVNYGSPDLTHIEPVLYASVVQENLPLAPVVFNGTFENCVIFGSQNEELELQEAFTDIADLNVVFDHCLLKTEMALDAPTFLSSLKNPAFADTTFVSRSRDDYHLSGASLARDAGASIGVPIDLEGKSRDATPDMGCYEF